MQQTYETKLIFWRAAAVFLLATTVYGQDWPRTTGDVFGFVVDESGQPVSGALVSHIQTLSPVAIQTKKGAVLDSGTAISQKDGAFFFRNLPQGSHKFCAELLGSDLLNPCEWSTSPPLANLAAGQLVSNLRIVLKKGTVVHVRLDDPDKVLRTKSGGKPENAVFVFLRSGNSFPRVVPVVVNDNNGQNHMLVAPSDVAFNLSVHSDKLRLSDKNQQDKSGGDQIPIQATKGSPAEVVRFTVKEK